MTHQTNATSDRAERWTRIQQLAQRPVAELSLSLEAASGDDAPALALCLIALQPYAGQLERIMAARIWLRQRYAAEVAAWIDLHPNYCLLAELDNRALFISRVFNRLYATLTSEKLQALDSLENVVSYLKMLVHAVIADRVRSDQAPRQAGGHETKGERSEDVELLPGLTAEECWQLLEEHFPDERERSLLYLIYVLGLEASEIGSLYPQFFAGEEDVHRLRKRVLELLLHHKLS